MHYCLSRDELKQLIHLFIQQKQTGIEAGLLLASITDEGFRARLDNSLNWMDELGGMAYLFAQILESNIFPQLPKADLIELFYDIPNRMFFSIQGIDETFVEYMLYRNSDLRINSLEDCLIELQNDLCSHRYDKATRLRYELDHLVF